MRPVKRGHERQPRPFRRGGGAPGGRARTGMNEVDLVLADDAPEGSAIGENGRQILAVDGRGDEFTAGAQNVVLQPSAMAGNDGAPARFYNRGRNLDSRPLGAARTKARDDLQDRVGKTAHAANSNVFYPAMIAPSGKFFLTIFHGAGRSPLVLLAS